MNTLWGTREVTNPYDTLQNIKCNV